MLVATPALQLQGTLRWYRCTSKYRMYACSDVTLQDTLTSKRRLSTSRPMTIIAYTDVDANVAKLEPCTDIVIGRFEKGTSRNQKELHRCKLTRARMRIDDSVYDVESITMRAKLDRSASENVVLRVDGALPKCELPPELVVDRTEADRNSDYL